MSSTHLTRYVPIANKLTLTGQQEVDTDVLHSVTRPLSLAVFDIRSSTQTHKFHHIIPVLWTLFSLNVNLEAKVRP